MAWFTTASKAGRGGPCVRVGHVALADFDLQARYPRHSPSRRVRALRLALDDRHVRPPEQPRGHEPHRRAARGRVHQLRIRTGSSERRQDARELRDLLDLLRPQRAVGPGQVERAQRLLDARLVEASQDLRRRRVLHRRPGA